MSNSIIIVENNDVAQQFQDLLTTHDQQTTVMRADELKLAIKKNPLRQLLSHKHGKLFVSSVQRKPFNLAVAMRLLCRGKIEIIDLKGQHDRVTLWNLLNFAWYKTLKTIQAQLFLFRWYSKCKMLIASASQQIKARSRFDPNKKALYLRTDLSVHIKAGGSVGHIAGVLNNLDHFVAVSLFISTAKIPTVRADIETELLPDISTKVWLNTELSSLEYNHQALKAILKKSRSNLGMIYQRFSPGNLNGLEIANQMKIPFVCEFNGSEVWVARHWGIKMRFEKLMSLIEQTNLACANLIVVVSNVIKNQLVEQGINEERILVKPNGVDPDKYHPQIQCQEVRQQYQLDDKLVFGFIGTFGVWHGAEKLAEAFGQLYQEGKASHWRLLMVGDGLTLPKVKEILEKYNAQEAAIFTGMVPQEQGPVYLAACDVLVSPHVPNQDGSPFIGSPTKIFEYMATGRAIIASDLDQIGEVLEHKKTAWLTSPGDTAALKEAMSRIAESQSLREALAQNAGQKVIEQYTWEQHTQKIITRLKELCLT